MSLWGIRPKGEKPQATGSMTTMTEANILGEDTPMWVPMSLTVVGAILAVTATIMFDQATLETPPAPPVATAPLASSTPPIVTSAPAASSAPLRRNTCPPIVVEFALNSATIATSDEPAIDQVGRWAKAHPETTVLIHGHADSLGSDEGNLALSKQRANAIATRLGSLGVDRARLTVRGFGSYQPVEGAPEEAASNRRAVIYVKPSTGNSCPGS